ncbi:MAG: hypothetical protein JWO11_4247, partial [Nocardioides sp.]|nr:hypothetical protein [Nocardioides sp.]
MTNLRSSVAVLGLLVGLVAVPTAPAQATIGGAYAAAAFKAT